MMWAEVTNGSGVWQEAGSRHRIHKRGKTYYCYAYRKMHKDGYPVYEYKGSTNDKKKTQKLLTS